MGLKDIRARLLLILGTLDAITGTVLTLAENVPGNRQDFEGWVLWVRHTRTTKLPAASQDRLKRSSAWIIEITSPQINTGWPAQREIQSLEYASALDELFDPYARLEDPATRVALAGVKSLEVGTLETLAPRPYPDGSPQVHYSVKLPLVIEFIRSKC